MRVGKGRQQAAVKQKVKIKQHGQRTEVIDANNANGKWIFFTAVNSDDNLALAGFG